MYKINERSTGNILWLRTEGKISKDEALAILDEIDRIIGQQGKVRILWEMNGTEGASPAAVWEDLKFDLKHRNDYERIAIVGDEKWQEMMTRLSKPFFSEMRWFSEEQIEEAWSWLKES